MEAYMKTFATLSFAGVTGIVLLKLFATLLFPLLGMILGLLAMTVKFALIAAVGFFIYSMIRKRRDEATA
jgi:hypothetical protein